MAGLTLDWQRQIVDNRDMDIETVRAILGTHSEQPHEQYGVVSLIDRSSSNVQRE